MPTLKNAIESLASEFASGVLQAIRGANLQELLGESRGATPAKRGPGRPHKIASSPAASATPKPGGKGGRLARRSDSDIEHVIGLLSKALSDAGKGLRSEELQRALKLDKKVIVRPLEIALKAKRITKKGQKRATTYFAAK